MYRKAEGQYEHNMKTGKWSFVRSGQNSMIRVEANFKDGALDGDLQEEERHPNPEASFFRTRFNYILSEDVNRLLNIAPHGSHDISLAI